MRKVSALYAELMRSHSLEQEPWEGTRFGTKTMDSILDMLTLKSLVRNTNEISSKMSNTSIWNS